jgi:hypothetical protein
MVVAIPHDPRGRGGVPGSSVSRSFRFTDEQRELVATLRQPVESARGD